MPLDGGEFAPPPASMTPPDQSTAVRGFPRQDSVFPTGKMGAGCKGALQGPACMASGKALARQLIPRPIGAFGRIHRWAAPKTLPAPLSGIDS